MPNRVYEVTGDGKASLATDGSGVLVTLPTKTGELTLMLPESVLQGVASTLSQLVLALRTQKEGTVSEISGRAVVKTTAHPTKDARVWVTMQEKTGLVHSFLLSREMAKGFAKDLAPDVA